MTPKPASDRDGVVAFAKEAFGFLIDVGYRLEVTDEASATTLAYVGDPLTFEVELDWLDRIAALLVCRTVDGRPPPGYYLHEGRLMRVHLLEALEFGPGADRSAASELRHVLGSDGPDAMTAQVSGYASVLRAVIDGLPSYADRIFP